MNVINQNFKSRTTLLELLKKNGFDTQSYEGFSKNEIDTMTRNNTLDMLITTPTEQLPLRKVYVKYFTEKTFSVNSINEIIIDLYENADEKYLLREKEDFVVIVTPEEPNEKIQGYLTTLFETRGIFITAINIRRLQFNVLNHKLQPREIHILTGEEKIAFMEEKNIKNAREDLPEISRFDPLAIALFLKPGEICHFVRDSPVAISSHYYRVCV